MSHLTCLAICSHSALIPKRNPLTTQIQVQSNFRTWDQSPSSSEKTKEPWNLGACQFSKAMRPFEPSSPVLEMGSASTAQAWSYTEGTQHLGLSLPAVLDTRCLLTAAGPACRAVHTAHVHGCPTAASCAITRSSRKSGDPRHTCVGSGSETSLPPPVNPQRIAGAEWTLLSRLKGSSAGELDILY